MTTVGIERSPAPRQPRSPRYLLQLPLDFATPGGAARAATCNISASGVLFETAARALPRLEPGQSLTVLVTLSDPATELPIRFEAAGRVVRVEGEVGRDGRVRVAAELSGLHFLAGARAS